MDHSVLNWWNSNEKQSPRSSFKNISFQFESAKDLAHDKKQLGLQLSDDSSPVQSVGQSHYEVAAGVNKSGDQCVTVKSGVDDSCTKSLESQMRPIVFLSNPDLVSKVDYGHSVDHVSYPHTDPSFGGMFAAYGPQTIFQAPVRSQAVGILPARVPLSVDEDGPIYVNAKQYHGILRRRQLRAKLEAQNKLIKNRKPYLHESRHLHALNRVRGSGGRFLSTKKLQKHGSASTNCSQADSNNIQLHSEENSMNSNRTHQSGTGEFLAQTSQCLDIRSVSRSDVTFQRPDHGFSSISSHTGGVMQYNGGILGRGTRSCASVVQ